MENKHFLVISMPGQGHINPMFQLGKCLIHAGAGRVTFATTAHGLTQVKAFPSLENLHYASFSDGFDDGIKPTNDPHRIMAELKRVGSQTLTELLLSLSKEGNPVSYLIYTLLLPWAADVARDMSIPSVFLCILSTIAFALCYCFFEERDGVYDSNDNRSPSSIEMPGLPLFTSKDMPSFLLPNDPHASTLIPLFQHHIQALEKDSKPCVLLNTSDCLEEEAIRLISNLNPIPIGPLVSYAFLDENNLAVLQKNQMEKILLGLTGTCRPFLWVIRPSAGSNDREFEEKIRDKVNEEVGLIVPWCSQMEVLTHESIGCFMMHCGWNSTLESLATGVPVLGFPQFSDQTTNAKMVEEVWRTGVRARVNEDGTLEAEEIERCLEMVMGGGQRGEEIRRNAKKWKGLTLEAVMEGGSSSNNLNAFLEKIE
ncbi:UDP-glycosyltransferase 75C1-like [Populus alba x Populus x berolinensis]|nr:UDP-glycosyltransferase 75C1-like [Populus alba x Populus x berolinensis]